MKARFPRFSAKITVSQVIKIILATTYTIVCAVIIIPKIDHQPWYPEEFRTYDLPAGIEFSSHQVITADITETSISSVQLNDLFNSIWHRISLSRLADADISIEGNVVTFELPADTTQQYINLLTVKGSVEILTPKNAEEFQENPILAYDIANYDPSGLSLNSIKSAEYKSQAEQFSYIDLSIKTADREKWNAFATKNSTSSIGLSIDGNIYQAWMLAASSTPNPVLVVAQTPSEARLIATLLTNDPLPVSLALTDVQTTPATDNDTLLKLYLLLLSSIVVALLLRSVLQHERIISTIATALTIVGVFAILKMTAIPVTTLLILSLILFSSLFIAIPAALQLPTCLLTFIVGLGLTASFHPAVINVGHAFIIAGVFGTLSSFFYHFVNIYEET